MVEGIGGTTYSLSGLSIYNIYYSEYQNYVKNNDTTLSFESYLRMKGRLEYFNQQLENYLETGNAYRGDGIDGNTINDARHVVNGNKTIYQSPDEETFYEFDFEKGTYRIIEGNEEVAQALGFSSDTDIDTLNLGYKSATATDYTFGNLDDGQDSSTSYLNSGYGNVAYVNQEFDIHYILNALLMNPNDPQYQIAEGIFNDLVDNLYQWCPQSDIDALDEIAAQYGTESAEYKDKLKEVLLANLDQANEWVEDHAHVEFVQDSTFTQPSDDSSDSSDSVNPEDKVPEYDRANAAASAGLSTEYGSNVKVETGKHWEDDHEIENAIADAKSQAGGYLDRLIAGMQAELGENFTETMRTYLNKAKIEVLNKYNFQYDEGRKFLSGCYATAWFHVGDLANMFYDEFDTLCANDGKSSAEVEAERKAEEERKAREKSDYQSLYNMDFNSAADDAGVPDTITVVPTGSNQYAQIQERAERDILDPLKSKIKSQYPNITEEDLDYILDWAADEALSNPDKWASTSNFNSYTVNSDKLIDIFKEKVKEGIKGMGYEF